MATGFFEKFLSFGKSLFGGEPANDHDKSLQDFSDFDNADAEQGASNPFIEFSDADNIEDVLVDDTAGNDNYAGGPGNDNLGEYIVDTIRPEDLYFVDNTDDLFHGVSGDPLDFNEQDVINFENLSALTPEEDMDILNDVAHKIPLEAQEIIGMGNHLIIDGDSAYDFVDFQEQGWTKLTPGDLLPEGVDVSEGYDTYVHESGAIVQIDEHLNTNFTE
ncbi:MAG: hypothetical protein ACPGXY_00490 [Alphaproteobacteria bacterium]